MFQNLSLKPVGIHSPGYRLRVWDVNVAKSGIIKMQTRVSINTNKFDSCLPLSIDLPSAFGIFHCRLHILLCKQDIIARSLNR